jgi:hypothetical protein
MTLDVKLILDEFNRRFDEWETRWDWRFSSAAYIDQPPTPPSVNHPSSDASARAPPTRAVAVGAVVIADNRGGCFDDGERYCATPSVIADDWGGLFDGEVATVNTEFADHGYGPSSTDPDAPHDADTDSFFINTDEGSVEPVFGDTVVGALGDVGVVPDLVEEEVPVDTPTKCLMRVLNRGDYYVSNRGDYYGPYTSSTIDATAVLLTDAGCTILVPPHNPPSLPSPHSFAARLSRKLAADGDASSPLAPARCLFEGLTERAMDELIRMAQAGERMWVNTGGWEVLHVDTYNNIFAKPGGSFLGPDVHVDARFGARPSRSGHLPSGCLIADMPDGSSKVTWIELEIEDRVSIHLL